MIPSLTFGNDMKLRQIGGGNPPTLPTTVAPDNYRNAQQQYQQQRGTVATLGAPPSQAVGIQHIAQGLPTGAGPGPTQTFAAPINTPLPAPVDPTAPPSPVMGTTGIRLIPAQAYQAQPLHFGTVIGRNHVGAPAPSPFGLPSFDYAKSGDFAP